MDEEQEAREAAVAARKAKMDAAFKRGGGEALAVGLQARAREDERRGAEQQAAYESKALALQEQKKAEARNKNQQQVDTLKEQVCLASLCVAPTWLLACDSLASMPNQHSRSFCALVYTLAHNLNHPSGMEV